MTGSRRWDGLSNLLRYFDELNVVCCLIVFSFKHFGANTSGLSKHGFKSLVRPAQQPEVGQTKHQIEYKQA